MEAPFNAYQDGPMTMPVPLPSFLTLTKGALPPLFMFSQDTLYSQHEDIPKPMVCGFFQLSQLQLERAGASTFHGAEGREASSSRSLEIG